MKKKLFVLLLALILTLPLLGLAEAATAEEPISPVPPQPMGRQYRRWNNFPSQQKALEGNRFVDEDKDGLCDLCGHEPGKNTQSPNFVDADGDGVCDHQSSAGQQRMGRKGGKGKMAQGMRKNQNCMCQGTPGRNFNNRHFNGPKQGGTDAGAPGFAPGRNMGPGRNRK